jgi:hypothetical protein
LFLGYGIEKVKVSLTTGITILVLGFVLVGEKQPLTRTIYVNLGFKVCEHIEDAYLYAVNDEGKEVSIFDLKDTRKVVPYGPLPLRRDFLFTYYPHLNDLRPLKYIFEVKGYCKGEKLNKYIVLGRAGKVMILHQPGEEWVRYVGDEPITTEVGKTILDFSDQLEQLDYPKFRRRDIHIKLFDIEVACPQCFNPNP